MIDGLINASKLDNYLENLPVPEEPAADQPGDDGEEYMSVELIVIENDGTHRSHRRGLLTGDNYTVAEAMVEVVRAVAAGRGHGLSKVLANRLSNDGFLR